MRETERGGKREGGGELLVRVRRDDEFDFQLRSVDLNTTCGREERPR